MPDLPRSTILVVDDERFNLDLLRDILSPTCDIMVATSGEQAIRRAASSPPPDLVLLDIQMPGMDGYRVLELLKADRGMFNFRWLQNTQSVVLIYNRLILSACQFQVQLPCQACPLRLTCSARFQA
ncbi:MAG: response regulator [Magnetococcus sp. DMHC-1]